MPVVGRPTVGKVLGARACVSRAPAPSCPGLNQHVGALPRVRPATCAGFIWDDQGHVVTNYHVLLSSLKGLGAAAADPTAGGTKAPPRIAKVRCCAAQNGSLLHR